MRSRFHTVGTCLLIVSALSLVSTTAPGADESAPRVQAEIERVVISIVDSGGGGDQTAILESIRGLEQAAGGSRPVLLAQLALYLAEAEGTERAMGAALLFKYFAFSPREIVAAVVPLLDTDDLGRRKAYEGLLATVDRPQGGEPEFEVYVAYLRESGAESPAPLIEYLYGVAPPAALSVLSEVYVEDAAERESLEDAARTGAALFRNGSEAVGDEVAEQLDRLSRSEFWWVRLYVREVVEAVPGVASPALLERLRSDEHPLVREGTRR